MTGISNFLPQLLAAPEASGTGSASGGGSLITMLVTFGLIIVVFYFLVIRPQNKKQKDAKKLLESIKKGDRVQTIGGLQGVVDSVKDDTVLLRVDDNVKLKFAKSAVATVLERKDEPAEAKQESKE
jgi:preprotein translocase subunit YajC